MSKVVLDVSMSLDGFIAGPNDEIDPLHDWLFSGDTPSRHSDSFRFEDSGSRDVLDEAIESAGATVAGRRTYDVSEWGGKSPFGLSFFIVTHHVPNDAHATFTFVTGGVETAVAQAHEAAGDKDVGVMGASVAQQCMRAGVLDEIQIHLVPVVLGSGVRLFDDAERVDLETTRVLESPGVTHLRYRVVK